jgi:hypothetical protein
VLECLDILIEAGATAKTRCGALKELLLWNAPFDVIEAFLEKTDWVPDDEYGESRISPLVAAIEFYRDPYRVTAALLKAGADPNKKNLKTDNEFVQLTALGMAIIRARREIVDILLAAGADPFAVCCSKTGVRPVRLARNATEKYGRGSTRVSILALFEALEAARERHAAVWPDLKREIMEAAWHPARLARLGFFDACADGDGVLCE